MDLGHHGSVLDDRFPYCRDSTPECHEPGDYQWFGLKDRPGDDPDDPGDGNNSDDDDDKEFIDAMEELDHSLAIFFLCQSVMLRLGLGVF